MKKSILLLFFVFFYDCLLAQETKSLEEILLSTYLSELEVKYNVSFSYNYSFFKDTRITDLCGSSLLDTCIKDLENTLSVSIQISGTNNYLLVPDRKEIKFKVVDSDDDNSVFQIYAGINNQEKKYYFPNKGWFSVDGVHKNDSIHLESLHYKKTSIRVEDLENMGNVLFLKQIEIPLKDVLIKGYLAKGIDVKLEKHSFQINMESLGLLAGETDGDVFSIIKNIPGISTPDGKPGNYNFRGSPFDHNSTRIDEIPMYYKGHFFGTISPYNPLEVENIEIYRNSLPVQYGGKVGGMISMKTTQKISDSILTNLVFNSMYTGGAIKIPLVKKKLGIALAGRISNPNLSSPKLVAFSDLNFQGSNFEEAADRINSSNDFNVIFSDINAKLLYQINGKNKFMLSYINIGNNMELAFQGEKDLSNQKDALDVVLKSSGINATWETKFSNKFSSKVSFVKSSFEVSDADRRLVNEISSKNKNLKNAIDDVQFIAQTNYQASKNFSIGSGYSLIKHLVNTTRSDDNIIDKQDSQEAIIHSININFQKDWKKRLHIDFGVHNDYYSLLEKFYFDPRFFLSYKLTQQFVFKMSGGQAHQYLMQKLRSDFDDFRVDTQIWELADDKKPVLRSQQGMFGGVFNYKSWLIDLEFYTKKSYNISQQQAESKDVLVGDIKTIGLDFFIKKRWGDLETWISYSLSNHDLQFEKQISTIFDQHHIASFTSLYKLKRWSFAATFNIASGTPVAVPENSNDSDFFDVEIPYDDRFPMQHQLDFSSTYQFYPKSKKWQGVVGLSIINLYDQENIVNIFQNDPKANNIYRTALGFTPNLQLGIKF